MLLFSLVFVAFLLFLSVNAKDVSKADSEQIKPHGTQTTPENPSTRIEINIGNPSNAAPPQAQEQHAIAEAKAAPITKGEWLIAGITAVYAVISYFMLRAIKRQASAAEADIAAQSPWIMVNVEYSPGMTGPFLGTSSGKDIEGVQQHTDFIFRFDCVNHGRTPALITEKSATLKMVPKGKLPNNPDLTSLTVFDRRVEPLAAGEKSKQGKDEYLSVPGYRSLDEWIVLYGVVKYRDVFGRDRQTTFGYEVTLGDKIERLPGYPEYNKNA
jgi:hypothetical protein